MLPWNDDNDDDDVRNFPMHPVKLVDSSEGEEDERKREREKDYIRCGIGFVRRNNNNK